MINYKKQSAKKAFEMIKPGQVIGLGDGATVLYLTDLIAINRALSESLTLTSSSTNTIYRMRELGLKFIHLSELKAVDFYFDGCDQFDQELNALKSAGGIHTIEKILAGMAREFVLIGDFDKYSESLSSGISIGH
jgi:ribose 5-phosphate isomerase A